MGATPSMTKPETTTTTTAASSTNAMVVVHDDNVEGKEIVVRTFEELLAATTTSPSKVVSAATTAAATSSSTPPCTQINGGSKTIISIEPNSTEQDQSRLVLECPSKIYIGPKGNGGVGGGTTTAAAAGARNDIVLQGYDHGSNNTTTDVVLFFTNPYDAGICIRGCRARRNVTIQNLTIQCHPGCRAIYFDDDVYDDGDDDDGYEYEEEDEDNDDDDDKKKANKNLSTDVSGVIQLLNLTVYGQVQLLIPSFDSPVIDAACDGGRPALFTINVDNVDIVSCDCDDPENYFWTEESSNYYIPGDARNILVSSDGEGDYKFVQGALTVYILPREKEMTAKKRKTNEDVDNIVGNVDVNISNLSIGRSGSPVRGSGLVLWNSDRSMIRMSSSSGKVISIKDVYASAMMSPTVTRTRGDAIALCACGLLIFGGVIDQRLELDEIRVLGSIGMYGDDDIAMGVVGPNTRVKSWKVEGGCLFSYGKSAIGAYILNGATVDSLMITGAIKMMGMGSCGALVSNEKTRVNDFVCSTITTYGENGLGIALHSNASVGTIVLNKVTTHGKGAIPIKLTSGASIETELRVTGSLETRGNNATTLAVDGARTTIASVRILRGRIHATGKDSSSFQSTNGAVIKDISFGDDVPSTV